MDNFLTIAASDNSGGAGVQQDLKVARDLSYWGFSAITGLTIQNFKQVFAIKAVDCSFLEAQIEQCFLSSSIQTVKIGALCSRENLMIAAGCLKRYVPKHVVLDPVLFSTSGASFLDTASLRVLKKELFPLAELITPNKPEFELLTNRKFDSIEKAIAMAAGVCREWGTSILLKGGHFNDPLIREAIITPTEVYRFERHRKAYLYSHGTGCTLSSALACYLGKDISVVDSYQLSSKYLTDLFDEIQLKMFD